jgi:hypothetical protein
MCFTIPIEQVVEIPKNLKRFKTYIKIYTSY